MNDKLDKSSRIVLTIFAALGFIVLCHSISVAYSCFSWPDLVVHVLYLICYGILFAYLYKEDISSPMMFKSSVFIYCITILLQNILFPAPAPSAGFNALTSFLSVGIVGCFIIWTLGWKNVKANKMLSVIILIAIVISCGFYTYGAIVMGPYFTSMAITVIGIWIRPFVAASIFVCYAFRMEKKDREKEQNKRLEEFKRNSPSV